MIINREKTKYFASRQEWREWLMVHFETEKEVWLVYPKKNSGKVRIDYNDAVEEALCFGWIDSTAKALDKDHFVQRFTPRRPKSSFSQPNRERLKWLAERKMIHPSYLDKVRPVISEEYVFPADIMDELMKDARAWENFRKLSESYKRLRIAYIDGARDRPDEFKKRLRNFMEYTRENRLIRGFGGIEKYY
jgi:uncharacterized protein YdeI (YjbR/CyaY-like superfamily)